MNRMPPAVEIDVVVGPKAEGARRATSALDSMYRTPAVSTIECWALALRFATIGVNQLGASSRRKPDVA